MTLLHIMLLMHAILFSGLMAPRLTNTATGTE
jgi:hypothetical protein